MGYRFWGVKSEKLEVKSVSSVVIPTTSYYPPRHPEFISGSQGSEYHKIHHYI